MVSYMMLLMIMLLKSHYISYTISSIMLMYDVFEHFEHCGNILMCTEIQWTHACIELGYINNVLCVL
jgi:hypothetical protein